jgi:hypothetical protein
MQHTSKNTFFYFFHLINQLFINDIIKYEIFIFLKLFSYQLRCTIVYQIVLKMQQL